MPKVQDPSLKYETILWQAGITRVAGLDEAGRGPWAGPVVAAAVIFPPDVRLSALAGIKDSKALSKKQKEKWHKSIKDIAQAVGVGFSSARDIDKYGIVPATKKAMLSALLDLSCQPQALLIDALEFTEKDITLLTTMEKLIPLVKNQQKFIKGEQVSYSIAAASIIAKQERDDYMCKLAAKHPAYGFDKHKGYGTKAHFKALLSYGPCPVHRQTFKPIRKLLDIGL